MKKFKIISFIFVGIVIILAVLALGLKYEERKKPVRIHLPYILTNYASPSFDFYFYNVKNLETIRILENVADSDKPINFYAEEPLSINKIKVNNISMLDDGMNVRFDYIVDENTVAIDTDWTPQFLFSTYIDIDMTDTQYQEFVDALTKANKYATVKKTKLNWRKIADNTIYYNELVHIYDDPYTGAEVKKDYEIKNNLPDILEICKEDYMNTINKSREKNKEIYKKLMQIAKEQTAGKETVEEKATIIRKWTNDHIIQDEEIAPCIIKGITKLRGTCVTRSYITKEMLEGLGIKNKIEYGLSNKNYHATNKYLDEKGQWILISDTEKFLRFDKRLEFK